MTKEHGLKLREARRARVRRIRARVIGGSVALFLALWMLITVVLVTGHDPALARKALTQAATTATGTTSSHSTRSSSSGATSSAATSSRATSSAATSSGATSSSTGSGSGAVSGVTSSQS
jgi:hypothetical protein